jgi:concentrative nucleoside transporter, CNT family
MMDRAVGVLGIAVFLAVAWLLSENRRQFPLRTVAAGLGLQFLLAVLILRTAAGKAVFSWLDHVFVVVLGAAQEGNAMVFGPLAKGALLEQAWGKENGFLFVVTVTGTIIVVSALSSVLFHYGILQVLVRGLAWIMQRVMGTSGSESLAAAANIFLGQTEAPLVVKPYLAGMTRSELMALMVPGMASIAGGVLAAYVGFGVSGGHLLTASVMSAPAALLFAKILIPETQQSQTAAGAAKEIQRETVNGIDAVCIGASDGMKLAMNVMAMLIAFVSLMWLLNHLLAECIGWLGIQEAKPLQKVFGWLNAPFAWLIGVPWAECSKAGELMGERIVLNELMAYLGLGKAELSVRSTTLMTYALCGFANFSSIAIQIGGIGALVPERRAELAQIGLRSMVGGLLACYCMAAVVGLVA